MSTDPTGLGNESCVDSTRKIYINVQFDIRDWCSYDKDCLVNSLTIGKEEACMVCKYRKLIDVPKELREAMKERIKNEILWRKFK